jgi:hypothetical protein
VRRVGLTGRYACRQCGHRTDTPGRHYAVHGIECESEAWEEEWAIPTDANASEAAQLAAEVLDLLAKQMER